LKFFNLQIFESLLIQALIGTHMDVFCSAAGIIKNLWDYQFSPTEETMHQDDF